MQNYKKNSLKKKGFLEKMDNNFSNKITYLFFFSEH